MYKKNKRGYCGQREGTARLPAATLAVGVARAMLRTGDDGALG